MNRVPERHIENIEGKHSKVMQYHPVPSTLCDKCTYFEAATSNSLRGGAFVRNVKKAQMDGRITGRLGKLLVYACFLIQKADII